MLKSLYFREEYRLKENPFPSDAIVRYGSQNIKDNGSIYNPDVSPRTMEEIKNRFIDSGFRGEMKFGFIWSLGEIDYTRGFGKTSTMLYLANRINADFGVALMREMGYEEEDIRPRRGVAAYSSFSATKATSFNWVLFQAIQYMNDNNVLLDVYEALCEKAIHELDVNFSAAILGVKPCSLKADANIAASDSVNSKLSNFENLSMNASSLSWLMCLLFNFVSSFLRVSRSDNSALISLILTCISFIDVSRTLFVLVLVSMSFTKSG